MIDLTSKTVFVVGANVLQNELITAALRQETGLPCLAVTDLAQIEPFLEGDEKNARLVLYDCLGKDGNACLADLEKNGADQDLLLALFNLDRDTCLEKEACTCGVRGFFYRGDPFSLFVKGVLGIFRGEFWISRRLLSQWIDQEDLLPWRMPHHLLSEPEKKILHLMADGATNREIADVLYLSPHTVKKYLQKIFSKIDVRNKTEAVLWAGRHLNV
jgi:DNA-binding NarL/FixJ family response regulator